MAASKRGYGYWLPDRKPEPITGTITLRDLQLFGGSSNCGTPVAVGEAAHVVVENVYEGAGGYQGFAGLPLDLAGAAAAGWTS